MGNEILSVENLVTGFTKKSGDLKAVRNISFHVEAGETLCIVGESGCGKSITALSIMGLLPLNSSVFSGSIRFQDKDLTHLSENEIQKIRGNEMSMIFQDPMTALNPVFTIGYQLREPLMIHKKMNKKQANKKSIELLDQVGISLAEKRMNQYPYELSGGMLQRVMIAISLACNPKLLIADEPTTALDVTIQAQILDLLHDMKKEYDTSIVMITHDMGVVAEIADRVVVMYAGELIEQGTVKDIFETPQHPYTRGLLGSVPDIDSDEFTIEEIPGAFPGIDNNISGCVFHPRCKYAMEKCKVTSPSSFEISDSHFSKCWLQREGYYDYTSVSNKER